MEEALSELLLRLRKIKRATLNGVKAPHKPILLLSVVQSIAAGEITENKIFITPQLVARFKDNWNSFVTEKFFSSNFALPFYHLSSGKFWFLKIKPEAPLPLTSSYSIKSFSALKASVDYAYLESRVYTLLMDAEKRSYVYAFLLEFFFQNKACLLPQINLWEDITRQILNDSPTRYRVETNAEDEEELFIRGGVFKKVVPEIYNYTCAISGFRVVTDKNKFQMVDACHIVPFALTHDDTINNGISLSPNLHRAFDHGLVTISSDFTVLISNILGGGNNEHIDLIKYHHAKIILPANPQYFPSMESLRWHCENRFKYSSP